MSSKAMATVQARLEALEGTFNPSPDQPDLRPEVAAAALDAIDPLYNMCGDIKLARHCMQVYPNEIEERFAGGDTSAVEIMDDYGRTTEYGYQTARRLLNQCGWDGVKRAGKDYSFGAKQTNAIG